MNTLAVNTGIDRNVAIFNERVAAYDKKPGARVGDYLMLPYGLCTRFTHKWDDHIQTGGNSSSFYLGKGYISYSGGLDSGVKLSDIELTDEVKSGMIWFFDKDISGAGRGVNFEMNFRVFNQVMKHVFPLESISTEQLMGKPVNRYDIGDVGKGRFTQKMRIRIDSLSPRQTHVFGGTLNYKLTGKGYTTPCVAITPSGNILIDGHHTVIVKKLKGQQYVNALTYTTH